MKQRIEFFVSGDPKGQPRARAFARNGMVRIYDPGTAEGWKSAVAAAYKEQCPTATTFSPYDAIGVSLEFWFARPKSHMGKRGLKDSAPRAHTQKPDCDNLAKAVLDAMTQLGVWRDDSQVWAIRVAKHWCNVPGSPGCNVIIHNE